MAEYIDRQELLENLNKFASEHYSALVNTLITKQPTADVVEVVRCKDCEYMSSWGRKDKSGYYPFCHKIICGVKENDFCSYGERRE